MSASNPLIFYDISSPLEPRSYAPNPSKARIALSYKAVPFTTKWIDLPDIPSIRQSLNCPVTRTYDDGSPYPTLPMLQDPSNNNHVLGDSFHIAEYLDATYPSSGGTLFPEGTKGTGLDYESPYINMNLHVPLTKIEGAKHDAYARFNRHVDATFTAHIRLFGYHLPFNPSSAEQVKAAMAKRAHLASWEDTRIEGEARVPLLKEMEEGVASLARLFAVNEGGPFLEGETPTYADFVVGGWLNMLSVVAQGGEFGEICGWEEGVFGRLHRAVQERWFVCM